MASPSINLEQPSNVTTRIIINMAAAEQENHDRPVRPRSYKDSVDRHGFLDRIDDLQKAGVLQDVIIEVEGRQFPCHRLVLSAASPYFRAMFTSGMAESRQKTVVLQGLDADMFGEIMSYFYSGNLHVSLDKVQLLYQTADFLQVGYVKDTCSSYMVMNTERSTCMDLYQFADVFSVDLVRKRSLQCICRHFAEVAFTEEFYSLSVNQLTEIISHDFLDVEEERTVWEAVLRWVQHSREDRVHHLPSILPHIRFILLTKDERAAIMEHPLVRENPGYSVVRNPILRFYLNPSTTFLKRVGMKAEEMVIIFRRVVDDRFNTEMLCVNPSSSWVGCGIKYSYNLPEIITATATSENDIYILTEESDSEEVVSVLQYNHVGNVWEQKSSIHRYTSEHRVGRPVEYLIEVGGQLYYLAIHTMPLSSTKSVTTVLKKYQWLTDQWQDCLKPTNDNLRFLVAVPCGQHLYFFSNTEMHRYDPSQDRLSKETMPRTLNSPITAVAIGTEIFCADATLEEIVVYDVEADSWRELPGLLDPNRTICKNLPNSPTFFAHKGKLHVLVEFDRPGEDQHLYVYDISAGAWKDLEFTLPEGPWEVCETVLPVARVYTCVRMPDENDGTRN
ncbi:kelch repeat and BTB domain-containing protein 12-like [Branchiostoma lanceolatum]|uniref:kelch repeat and BTB domain-containing protein 12-like n=1 Tax=Branchiostoma lanceolatum TaxID=7740 RepID=UPI003451BC76